MNTLPYSSLISNEQAKIAVMRTKIEECEQRIAMLQSMQIDDDLDVALTRRVEGTASKSPLAIKETPPKATKENSPVVQDEPKSEELPVGPFPKKLLNLNTLKMLRFAGTTDKSINQFCQFAKENGITDNRQRVRATLHQYKSMYKLLESKQAGHFKLSSLGIAYLASLRLKDEGETSSAQ